MIYSGNRINQRILDSDIYIIYLSEGKVETIVANKNRTPKVLSRAGIHNIKRSKRIKVL